MLRCLLKGEPDELIKAAAAYRVVGCRAADRDLEDLFLVTGRANAKKAMAQELADAEAVSSARSVG